MASITTAQGIKWLKDSASSDFRITVGSATFPVHKAVLRLKSDFFASCVDGSFQEANRDSVDIQEASPFVGALLVLYIYTNTLDLGIAGDIWPNVSAQAIRTQTQPTERFKVYMEMYQVADRLMVDDMVTFVTDKIIDLVSPLVKAGGCKAGLEIMQAIFENISNTAKVRVDLVVLLVVQKRQGYQYTRMPGMKELLEKHEPAAWAVGICK